MTVRGFGLQPGYHLSMEREAAHTMTSNELNDGEVVCAVLGMSSEPAARMAARLAERLSLRLALVDVQVPIPPPAGVGAEGLNPVAPAAVPSAAPEVQTSPAVDLLEWEKRLVAPPDTRCDVVVGPPGHALTELSEAVDTRILVVGDDGGGALRSKVTGNAGRDVARHAPCPILLVPSGVDDTADGRTIVCGIDDDESVAAVAEVCGRLAGRLGGRLRFVHVLERSRASGSPVEVELDALDQTDRGVAERLFDACRLVLEPGVAAEFVVMRGDAGSGLAAAAAGGGFVVVGQPHHGALGSALLGSATHDFLRDAAVPLLVVPVAPG